MSSALHSLKDKLSGSKEGEQQVGIQPHPAVRLSSSLPLPYHDLSFIVLHC